VSLIDFASWCFESEGNQARTISGKFAAIQYFHRTQAQVEVATTSQLTNCVLRGIARAQVELGVHRRIRLPVTWGMLRDGEDLEKSWGPGGRVMWLCLSLSYFLITRSDEMFAASSGRVHPAHCLTRRDVAFFRGDRQLAYIDWRQADKIEVHFRGHKGDQEQRGNVRVRTRDETHGPRSGYRADGGAVALVPERSRSEGVEIRSGLTCIPRDSGEIGTEPERIRVAFAPDRRGVHPSSGEGGSMGLRGVQNVHSVQRRGCETSFP